MGEYSRRIETKVEEVTENKEIRVDEGSQKRERERESFRVICVRNTMELQFFILIRRSISNE